MVSVAGNKWISKLRLMEENGYGFWQENYIFCSLYYYKWTLIFDTKTFLFKQGKLLIYVND